jgi:hypothetical protein
MPTTEGQLELPAVDSPEFMGLVATAIIAPYVFCLCIYRYHFVARKTHTPVRGDSDKPLKAHTDGWQDAIFRPEGISAPVGYMALCLFISQSTDIDLVPTSVKTLAWLPNPLTITFMFLVFDLLMWHIHYVQVILLLFRLLVR